MTFLAARNLSWSYTDNESLLHVAELMARDPFVQREIEAINTEFQGAEADGLEEY